MAARLTEWVHPATLPLVRYYHQLGLRERLLTLPVMVAFVLSLIWRQFNGVSEVVRVVQQEALWWVPPLQRVSQQALAQRLRTWPATLCLRLLCQLVPVFHARWQARQRPLPAVIAWAQSRYTQLLMGDGSTLDALIRKVGWLRDLPTPPWAGRITALLELASRLPWGSGTNRTHRLTINAAGLRSWRCSRPGRYCSLISATPTSRCLPS